jgi:2'-5' RNA ligase
MTVIRAFIAMDLPTPLKVALDRTTVELKKTLRDMPLRWVRIENIHLTLKFLGQVKAEDIERIKPVLAQQAASFVPVDVSIDGFGTFPNPTKPLVLWIGLRAGDGLVRFQAAVEAELAQLGFAPEERGFNPHLTVARVRRDHRVANLKRIAELMAATPPPFEAAAKLDSVTLYRSDLKPGGSVYNPLVRFSLTGAADLRAEGKGD